MVIINWINTNSAAISAISTTILAIGTIALAFIAIFQDTIRTWHKHPTLDLTIDNRPPDCQKTPLEYPKTTLQFTNTTSPSLIPRRGAEIFGIVEAYYFRCKVTNSGNEKAELVEVFASELSKTSSRRYV